MFSNLRQTIVTFLQNPKVQRYLLAGGAYAAGAYGGPAAKVAVEKYGPEYGPYLLKGLVLLLGG